MNLESSTSPQLSPQPRVFRQTFARRALYRLRQFWLELWARPSEVQLEQARSVLTAPEMALFLRMQPGEQAHSLNILFEMQQHGHAHPGLLAAALLHDVGKVRYPLHIWERVLIVLAAAWLPRQARAWGDYHGQAPGWRKPFVVARQHAAWGAELAAQAGSPALTVALIRRHQDHFAAAGRPEEDHLLACLQAFDNESY